MDDDRVGIVIEVQDDKTSITVHGMSKVEAIGTLEIAKAMLMRDVDDDTKGD
jgi:hypothetical protein